MNRFNLTTHAQHRIQQRGIHSETLQVILQQADKFHYTREGAQSIFVSQKKIKKLLSTKKIKPYLAEKLKKVVLVENQGVILTAFHQTKKFYKN